MESNSITIKTNDDVKRLSLSLIKEESYILVYKII